MSHPTALKREGVSLDAFGVLRRDESWVALPTLEAKVAARLLADIGDVVPTAALCHAVWPGRDIPPNNRPLSVLVFRLRRRIAPLGITISTIRSHGFMLHV